MPLFKPALHGPDRGFSPPADSFHPNQPFSALVLRFLSQPHPFRGALASSAGLKFNPPGDSTRPADPITGILRYHTPSLRAYLPYDTADHKKLAVLGKLMGNLAPRDRHDAAPDTLAPERWTDPGIPAWRRVIGLASPVLAQQVLGLVVNLTDRWLAGNAQHFDGADQLALQGAQTTCFYLAWMIGSFGVLATTGASALVARMAGSGDLATANHACHQATLLAFGLGIAGWCLAGLWLDDLLWALNLDGAAGEFAFDYLGVTVFLLPMQLVGATVAASLAGTGDTRTGLWVSVATTLANLPLAWIGFRGIAGWKGLGISGIAWGTGLSQALGALALLILLRRGRSGLRWKAALFRPDQPLLGRLLRISLPAGAESLSLISGQLLFLAAVNRLGDADRSAHGIALGWESVAEIFGMAFAVAANVLVGQCLGAGQPREARRSGLAAFCLGAALMSAAGAFFYLLAKPMFLLFCPSPEQGPVVEAGVPVLRLVAFSMPMLASCHICASALRGAGDTRFPLLFTWLGLFLVRIPLTWWLSQDRITLPWGEEISGRGLGLYGCWIAMQVDIHFRGILFLVRLVLGTWMRTRV